MITHEMTVAYQVRAYQVRAYQDSSHFQNTIIVITEIQYAHITIVQSVAKGAATEQYKRTKDWTKRSCQHNEHAHINYSIISSSKFS